MAEDQRAEPPDNAVLIYAGEVSREGYRRLTQICGKGGHPKSVTLILITYGGDAHAGYRMGRCLQHHFEKITVLIPDMCKSAGTLMAMSASEVVMCDRAEMGPLDVQVIKNDELFERASGLDLPQSINALKAQVLGTFRDSLIDMRMGGRLSTKIAGELAAKITTGLFEPVFAQIDPLKLGELQRANTIGFEYGTRLAQRSKNINENAISRLIATYPSHSFVIDRKEAASLFQKVRGPNDDEAKMLDRIYPMVDSMLNSPSPIIDDFTALFYGETDEQPSSGANNVRNPSSPSQSNEGGGSEVDEPSKGNGRARAKKPANAGKQTRPKAS